MLRLQIFTDKLCIINIDFSFNSTQAINIRKLEKIGKTEDFAPEDYRHNVNWKEILDTTLNWLEQKLETITSRKCLSVTRIKNLLLAC